MSPHLLGVGTSNPVDIIDLVTKGGALSMALIIIWTGIKRKWVFGWVYDGLLDALGAMTRDRDEWKNLTLSLLRAQDRTLDMTERMLPGDHPAQTNPTTKTGMPWDN